MNDTLKVNELKEIVVTDFSARNRIQNSHLGSETLELNKLSLTPQLFGEADIIKSITLLPGVRNETDGADGIKRNRKVNGKRLYGKVIQNMPDIQHNFLRDTSGI